MKYLWIFVGLVIIGPLWALFTHQVSYKSNWRSAGRESAHLAPDPAQFKPAIIQVYAARTYHSRGLFSVHTWIAAKPENAKSYTVYQVFGWIKYYGRPAVLIRQDLPDRFWFDNPPWIIKDLRGEEAARLIPKIDAVARNYPYNKYYLLWPGPNSNTFIAYIARQVPELELVMPPIAIGKDYLVNHAIFAKAPSGTGYQVSLFGMLGVLVAAKEGVEINILGLVFGVRFHKPWLILPGIAKK